MRVKQKNNFIKSTINSNDTSSSPNTHIDAYVFKSSSPNIYIISLWITFFTIVNLPCLL